MFRKARNFKALICLIFISMLFSLPGYSQNHYSQKFASLTNWTKQDNASVVSVDLKNANTVKQITPIPQGKDHSILDMLTTNLKSAFTNFSFISTAQAGIIPLDCCQCSDGCFDLTGEGGCLCFPPLSR